MSNLAKRFATAGVLIPIVLAVIYLDDTAWGVGAFAAVFAAIGLDEYLRMALPVSEEDPAWLLRATGWALAAAMILLPIQYGPGPVLGPLLTAAVLMVGFALLARPQQLPEAGRHFGAVICGLVYVPLLLSTLPLLKVAGRGDWITIAVAMAALSDTVAYFFGRAFGKHKLYEAVSPKKTIQGAVGGLLGATIATVGLGHFWLIPDLPIIHGVALGILGSMAGQIGDLVESMIKRTYGAKDSGAILPGHGGVLDRIDAVLFIAPVVFYYLRLVA